MINRIIGYSIKNRVVVIVLVAAACLWGAWSMMHLPLDATPNLSETQVIILSRWDRSPDVIEDQVTYPNYYCSCRCPAGKCCTRHFRLRFLLSVRDL